MEVKLTIEERAATLWNLIRCFSTDRARPAIERAMRELIEEEANARAEQLLRLGADAVAAGAREAERARCLEMLKRCHAVYRRNNPPMNSHEAFQKQTAIEYALMVVGDWSVSDDFRENFMPMPY